MKTFIALYYNTSGVHQAPPEMTAEQQAEMMAPWGAWQAKYGERVKDMGSPLLSASSSTDGESWSSSQHLVTGYSLVTATSLAEAEAMFKGHPIYSYPDHSIEISECVPM